MTSPNARAIGWRALAACALITVLVEAISRLSLAGLRDFDRLSDPDSYMRLVRLRDIVAAHRPLGVVANDASGHGTILHWSHLLDSFILLLAEPFGWFLPIDTAQHIAGLLFGVLSVGALGAACAWAIVPCVKPDWRWLAPVVAIMAPSVWAYGLIGVVHHHIPVVLVAVMCWGWAARLIAGSYGGIALGAWAAAGLWLTPESLLLSVLAFGAVLVAWMADGGPRLPAAIRAAGVTMLVLTSAAWFVDPPSAGHRAMEVDRISIVFVGVAAVFAALGIAIVAIERHARAWPARLAWTVFAGVVLTGVWLFCFPVVLNGADTLMAERERHAFFDRIEEMQPVRTWADGLQYLYTAVLAFLFMLWRLVRERSAINHYAATCLAALIALGAMHTRFSPYAAVAAALLVPKAMDAVRHSWIITRAAIVILVLVPPLVGAIKTTSAHGRIAAGDPSCDIGALTKILAPFGNAVVLANVNDSPALLYRTHLKTVGSLYHRNPAAFMRLWQAWRSRPGTDWTDTTPPPEVLATEATLLIFCPTHTRSIFVRDLPDDTLADWLSWGQIPRWLHEIARDAASGNIVYRIER